MTEDTQPSRTGAELLAELATLDPDTRLAREVELLGEFVDAEFYLRANPSVADAGVDPVEHFCRFGWRELRRPNPGFDVWWYWANYLDPGVDELNPLLHYALIGRYEGLDPRPVVASTSDGHVLPADRPIRRACLFAAFDADCVVDESTVMLVRELARFSDVFFLSDGYLPAEELAKLDGIAAGAWAIRHGAYDFGSYSLLARDLVGWQRLESYDEVLLVNDSCFLVRPLDEVFDRMSQSACDWWGLQATKGLASTRDQPGNDFPEPIPLDMVRDALLERYEDDPVYDFLVGSYFLAFRRPVLDDPRFRALLSSVHQQPSKLLIILKYEIGLTHLLIGRGYRFDTFMPALYPFHPVFSEWYFTMLENGFPLLKRYFIYQNHYDVPGLAAWKARVLEHAPDADVDLFERTLTRTAPDDRLRRSFAITRHEDGSVHVPAEMTPRAFRRRDATTAKDPDTWVFAVDPRLHTLPDNSRALFEAVRNDPSIRKVVLTRTRRVDLSGANTVVEPLTSPAGRELLQRAGVVLVGAQPRLTLGVRASTEQRTLVVVRDGLMLEKTGRTAAHATRSDHSRPPAGLPLPTMHPMADRTFTAVLTASDTDQLAAVASHWPARYTDGWRTGIPAHDLLLCDSDALPDDLRAEEARLTERLRGRRLLLFMPTPRRSGTDRAPYSFTDDEIKRLAAWAARSDAVIGVREPDGDLERPYSAQLIGALGHSALDLSHQRLASTPVALRACDALLTDYSGAALDLLVTGKPAVSFAHDLATAVDRLLYDPRHVFPGPVCTDFDELEIALDNVFAWGDRDRRHARRVRDLFVQFDDGRNTERAVAHLRAAQREAAS